MIDTDKYTGHTEGHKEGSWDIYEVYGSDNKLMKCIRPLHDKWGVDLPLVASKDAQLIADVPLLLAEVKRLQKLEAAVVGSWMRACDHRGPWHKALRYPCVELGYLTYNAEGWINYELSEEYQNMAKEWVKEHYGDEEE